MIKKLPGIEKRIKEINDMDTRVKIVGTVITIDESIPMITIDDGTGIANVVLDNIDVNISDNIRVIGRVVNTNPVEIRGEIIQKFDLRRDLYEKYLDIIDKVLNKTQID